MSENGLRSLLHQATQQLEQAGVDSPGVDAELLATHVMGISRGDLAKEKLFDTQLSQEQAHSFTRYVNQRAQRIPLQLLVGSTGFYGLDIAVSPGVFIPRVETEVLVELALDHIDRTHPVPRTGTQNHNQQQLMVVDLCTGTGAIVCALADQLHTRGVPARLWGVELSETASELANQNAQQLTRNLQALGDKKTASARIRILKADATDIGHMKTRDEQLAASIGGVDLVTANPPYVPQNQIPVQTEARVDPQLALYGGSLDGTAIPTKIAATASTLLKPGGFFVMEHEETHGEQLCETLRAAGEWDRVTQHQDLTGRDRFISAIRKTSATPTHPTDQQVAQ